MDKQEGPERNLGSREGRGHKHVPTPVRGPLSSMPKESLHLYPRMDLSMPWFIHLSICSFIYSLTHTYRMLGPVLGGEECGKMNMPTGSLTSNFTDNSIVAAKYDLLYESTGNTMINSSWED